jgi:hypothetical protein
VQGDFDNLNALLKKYSYFPDIVQAATKNTFNDVAATHGVKNLVPEIQSLRVKVPNDIPWFLLRDSTMSDAINQINAFERYIAETLPRLQQLRSEIEASEIYEQPTAPGKKSEGETPIITAALAEFQWENERQFYAMHGIRDVEMIDELPDGSIRFQFKKRLHTPSLQIVGMGGTPSFDVLEKTARSATIRFAAQDRRQPTKKYVIYFRCEDHSA